MLGTFSVLLGILEHFRTKELVPNKYPLINNCVTNVEKMGPSVFYGHISSLEVVLTE